MSFATDNDVIEDVKAQDFGGFSQPTLKLEIGFAGAWIAAWVIVREDHGRGTISNDVCEDFTRMHRSVVE